MGTAKKSPGASVEGGGAEGQPGDDFTEKREGENRERKLKMDCRER